MLHRDIVEKNPRLQAQAQKKPVNHGELGIWILCCCVHQEGSQCLDIKRWIEIDIHDSDSAARGAKAENQWLIVDANDAKRLYLSVWK